MPTVSDDTFQIPDGLEFLRAVWAQEDECASTTDRVISDFGKSAPKTLQHLGTVLSYLDRVSTCHWQCFGGDESDHRVEYLLGRAYSRSRAALRLLRLGFYDEALSLTRMVGESANLLLLFLLDSERWRSWCPRGSVPNAQTVRRAILKAQKGDNSPITPLGQSTWDQLSERTHAGLQLKPNAYNEDDRPTTGAYFQLKGALIALNELSEATGYVAGLGATLARHAGRLDPEHRKTVVDASVKLLVAVGSVRLGNIQDL
jgi:hypothetical protein